MAVDLLRPALRQAKPRLTTGAVAFLVNLVASGLVLALILAFGAQWFLVQQTIAGHDAQIATLQPQWNAVRAQSLEMQRMRRDVNTLQSVFIAPVWVDVFEAVRAALPAGLWLSKVAVTDAGGVEVTVRTNRPPATGLFIQRLQATPGLRDVRLVLTETVRVAGVDLAQATIAASVVLP